MLHFRARLVRDAVATHRLAAAQSQLTQHPRQRRVADPDAFLFEEFLVDPLHPAITFAVQTLQQLNINVLFVAPLWASELSLLLDNPPHGIAADMQPAADLALRHPPLMQLITGVAYVRSDHRTPPSS